MSKLLLINPPLSAEERYGRFAKAGSHFPPLGLASLAAVTREAGFETKIIDSPALNLGYEETLKLVVGNNPDIVGLTSTTISIYNAGKIAQLIKGLNKEIIIVVGGAHITAVPQETMKRFPDFDIGVIGEGELTIIELLKAIENKTSLKGIRGLILRDGGNLVETGIREFIAQLDTLPLLAWDLLPDLPKYYRPSAQCVMRLPSTTLITGRGCPGRCTFCDRKLFGSKCRLHSAGYVMKMIRHLYTKYGMRDFQIDDDTFVMHKARLKEVCESIISERLNINWSALARVNYVDPGMLKLMKKAGCWQIQYGIESADQKILNFLKKDITIEQVQKALRWTKEAKIKTKGFFIIGHPIETLETIEKTMNFIVREPLDDFQITIFTPFPGSEIYEEAKKYGDFDDDWRKMNQYNVIFVPKGLTYEQIQDFQGLIYRKFYLRPRVIFSYLMRIRNLSSIWAIFMGFIGFMSGILTKKKQQEICTNN